MRVAENLWYPLVESREIRRKPLGVERLGRRFVFWRDADGSLHAHADRCPHLGAALSAGRVNGSTIVCPFHGFHFGGNGQCTYIPANGKAGRIPKGMAVRSFPVREAQGIAWLWWGDSERATEDLPCFPQLEQGWHYDTTVVDWPVHYTRAIENQLDVAHIAFVHRTTIGRGNRRLVNGPYVEADDSRIRVWVKNTIDDGREPLSPAELAKEATSRDASLDFQFPGLWLLNISERLKNVIAFAPINESQTRYYVRTYHRIGSAWRGRLFAWMMRASNRFILSQDRAVVVTQMPPASFDATEDRLIGADRAIVQYRRMHERLLGTGPLQAD